jgi:hypothetical protein
LPESFRVSWCDIGPRLGRVEVSNESSIKKVVTMATKTITLTDEMINGIEQYQRKLQRESGKPVTFVKAFRVVMDRVVDALLTTEVENHESPGF